MFRVQGLGLVGTWAWVQGLSLVLKRACGFRASGIEVYTINTGFLRAL